MPNAPAPPIGASHSSVGADEKSAWAGNKDTDQTAARPVAPNIAETPHRVPAVHRTGHVNAKTITSAETTKGPVRAGRLGKNAVNTAKIVAAETVVKTEIVLRTPLSCHVSAPHLGWKTVSARDLTGTVIVGA